MPRPKGSLNKVTQRTRAAFATFVDGTFDDFEQWVKRTAKRDPRGAADLYLRAAEYHIPKLGRTELAGKDDGPLIVEVVKFTDSQ